MVYWQNTNEGAISSLLKTTTKTLRLAIKIWLAINSQVIVNYHKHFKQPQNTQIVAYHHFSLQSIEEKHANHPSHAVGDYQ